MKFRIFSIIIILILFVLSLVYFLTVDTTKPNNDSAYFKKYNFEFAGIVTDKLEFGHSQGIVFLKITRSNIDCYNPFINNDEKFYCYIDKGIGELYTSPLSFIEKNDILVVSSSKDSNYVIRNNKIVHGWNLYLLEADAYYKRIKKRQHIMCK